jgi:hypothetical protein
MVLARLPLIFALPPVCRCIKSGKYASAVESDLKDGQEAVGIRGSPTFFPRLADSQNPMRIRALRSLLGNLPFAEFQKAVDQILTQANHRDGVKR